MACTALAWISSTPIIPLESVMRQRHHWLPFSLNPLHHLAKLFRLALYYNLIPDPGRPGTPAVGVILALATGWIVSTRNAEEFDYCA